MVLLRDSDLSEKSALPRLKHGLLELRENRRTRVRLSVVGVLGGWERLKNDQESSPFCLERAPSAREDVRLAVGISLRTSGLEGERCFSS